MKLSCLASAFLVTLATSTVLAASPALRPSSAATLPPFSTIATMNPPKANLTAPLLTLDVVGIGMSVEMFRQSQVWAEMQKHRKGSILPVDLTSYTTNSTVKQLATDKRRADALESGASRFVEAWAIPSVSVWSHCYDPEVADNSFGGKTTYDFFNDRVDDLRRPSGMHYHLTASLGSIFLDEPEEILERAPRSAGAADV